MMDGLNDVVQPIQCPTRSWRRDMYPVGCFLSNHVVPFLITKYLAMSAKDVIHSGAIW
jgi:hypothetical protein